MADRIRSTTPPPRPRAKTLDGLPRPSRPPIAEGSRRLTLTLSGPPLALDEPGAESPSTRSYRDLDVPTKREFADVEAHDAWADERRARSTTPPRAPSGGWRAAPAPSVRKPRATPSGSLPVPDEADAYRLIERARPAQSLDLAAEVEERYALGDFSGALRAAELWLGADPDSVVAKNYAESCREHLEQFYRSRLGSFDRVVHVAVAPSEIRWLGLDHRAGFFLSRIDGMTTIDELLDLSGMPRLESLKTLVELLEMGAVRLQ